MISKTNRCSSKITLAICSLVIAAIAATLILLTACNRSPDGVAARVGDTLIMEDQITTEIQAMREQNGYSSDAQWKAYLSSQNMTSNDVRNQTIDNHVEEEIIIQLAEQWGMTVSQEQIDTQIAQVKSSFSSEEEYQQTLAQYGMTEEDLITSTKATLLQDKVADRLVEETEISEDKVNEFYMQYSSSMNGAKGYYQIMFPESDSAKAAEYDAKIKSGQMTFEDACKEVTAADKNGYNFDYVAYSNFIQNPDAVKNAMSNMHVGDYSGIINAPGSGYVYMIKVVDEVNQEDTWSIKNLPEQTQNNIVNYVKHVSGNDIFAEAIDNVKKDFDVVVYDKPGGLPYSTGIF